MKNFFARLAVLEITLLVVGGVTIGLTCWGIAQHHSAVVTFRAAAAKQPTVSTQAALDTNTTANPTVPATTPTPTAAATTAPTPQATAQTQATVHTNTTATATPASLSSGDITLATANAHTIQSHLEEYDAMNGYYPANLDQSNFPDADPTIFTTPAGVSYVYKPSPSSNSQHYTLDAVQSSNSAVLVELKDVN